MTNCVRRHDEIAGKEHPAHSARPEASLMLSLQNAPPASMRALFPLLLPAVLLLKLCNDAASGRSDLQALFFLRTLPSCRYMLGYCLKSDTQYTCTYRKTLGGKRCALGFFVMVMCLIICSHLNCYSLL